MAGDPASSHNFDPYHKWLGISPQLRPPNYYRLLGLESFEDDADTIEAAADRLIAFVRDASIDERPEVGKQILAELQTAKKCLLSREQKQAYDAGLRASAVGMHDPPIRREQENPTPQPTVQDPRKHRSLKPKIAKTKRQVSLLVWAIVGGCVGLVLVVAVGRLWLRDPHPEGSKPVAIANTTKTQESIEAPSTPPTALTTNDSETDAVPTIDEPVEIDSVAREAAPIASDLPDFVAPSGIDAAPTLPEPLNQPEEPATVGSVQDDAGEAEEVARIVVDMPIVADESIAIATTTETTFERGSVLRDIWSNVTGNQVEEFVRYVKEHPVANETESINRLETPEDYADQYGQRLRGFLYPPATGEYEFLIRANAEGWLFVGTDATRESLRRVEPKTKVELTGGEVYSLEAFHKESTGRDYFSVGWKLPDGTEENPIGGERLSQHYRIAPLHESEFVVLTPTAATSQSEATLTIQEDGRIVVGRNSPDGDVYQLTFATEIETITALRLEALPDASLPARGPGHGVGGRFSVGEVSVSLVDNDTSDAHDPSEFASVIDGAGRDTSRIVDGDLATMWRANGRGESSSVTLVFRNPIAQIGGTKIKITLRQQDSLGCFRILATSAANPNAVDQPTDSSSEQDLFALFVNVGGDDFVAPDGIRWQGSKFFDNETFGHEGGNRVSEDQLINQVQGTAMRGISAFRAVVPDGSYDVTLFFCEYWSSSANSRRFAIAAEHKVIAPRFDLLQASGGFAQPFILPIRNLSVTDGRLDVQFKKASESSSTILNAISIQQVPQRKRR